MSKNLNQEAAKAPGLVNAGIDEATQAAQNDPGVVGTTSPAMGAGAVRPEPESHQAAKKTARGE